MPSFGAAILLNKPMQGDSSTPMPKISNEEESLKLCARCKGWHPYEAFSKHNRYKDGHQSYCRPCMADYRVANRQRIDKSIKEAKARNPDKYRDQYLRSKYNITLVRYTQLLEEQKGVCAICGIDKPRDSRATWKNFYVDHDHACCPGKNSCGKCVRGLLCGQCNFGIGQLSTPKLLKSANKYLRNYNDR